MNSTKPTFDYENKQWGATPITSYYTDLQGFELYFLIKDIKGLTSKKNIRFLDLGCGAGNIPGFFSRKFPYWRVTGVDISSDAIKTARLRYPSVEFMRSPADSIKKLAKTYGLITGFDSLEHFDHLDAVLKEAKRLLKDDGLFYISIPLEKQFPSLYWILYLLGWRGKMVHSGHVNYFNDKQVEKLLQDHGFKLIKKRFSYHLFFSIMDIGYYFMQSLLGRQSLSLESNIEKRPSGFIKLALSAFKRAVAAISFFESYLLWWFPGGKGHFIFIKNNKNDFFSQNPPVTVLESVQQETGLQKILRPKDLQIASYLNRLSPSKSATLLDFGSANGIWLERLLSGRTWRGIGVDVADKLIDFANSRKNKKGTYLSAKNSWPVKPASIDFCYSFDTFEHVTDKKQAIKRIHASLKKGGKFLFYTLNPQNKYTLDWLFEKFGSDYLYKRADHVKELFYDPAQFALDLQKAGFTSVRYALYDGPANLFWDVSTYLYLGLLEKMFAALGISGLLTVFINFNDWFIRLIFPLNNRIDYFFFSRGYSNGYFIWGEK